MIISCIKIAFNANNIIELLSVDNTLGIRSASHVGGNNLLFIIFTKQTVCAYMFDLQYYINHFEINSN